MLIFHASAVTIFITCNEDGTSQTHLLSRIRKGYSLCLHELPANIWIQNPYIFTQYGLLEGHWCSWSVQWPSISINVLNGQLQVYACSYLHHKTLYVGLSGLEKSSECVVFLFCMRTYDSTLFWINALPPPHSISTSPIQSLQTFYETKFSLFFFIFIIFVLDKYFFK